MDISSPKRVRYSAERRWLDFFLLLSIDASISMWKRLELGEYGSKYLEVNYLAKKAHEDLIGNAETVNQLRYTPAQVKKTVAKFLLEIKTLFPKSYYTLFRNFVLIHEGLQPISGSRSYSLFCDIYHQKIMLPPNIKTKEEELRSIIFNVLFESTINLDVENLFTSGVSKSDARLISFYLSEESVTSSLDCVLVFFEIRLCWFLISEVLDKTEMEKLVWLKNN